ncbi:MAG: hypothetical protein IRY99_13510 [Isosphaeraceae bacterium]|nr:hypothetical protein [Isosphaeraceae bacterium]
MDRGEPGPCLRWVERGLDAEGVPKRLKVGAWWPCLDMLAEARRRRPTGWPAALDRRIEGWVRAALRFSRPDGSAVFEPTGASPERANLLAHWAGVLPDPGLATVIRWWFPAALRPRRGVEPAPPPLPAMASRDRPLAMLRPDWTPNGDFVAIDQRDPGAGCRVEVTGLGVRWLGPAWGAGLDEAPMGPARPTFWTSSPRADCAEWSFRTPSGRITRTALLLRGRGLALLADQVASPGPVAAVRLEVPPTIQMVPQPDTRAWALRAGRNRSARVLPLALPAAPYPTERGALEATDHALRLRQRLEGGRCWLPLLLSWRGERHRKAVRWRILTVSEQSRICPPSEAVAVWVAWGMEESLVIYRSLARPALRSFLGYQTKARFLVGGFTSAGNVAPLLQIEE